MLCFFSKYFCDTAGAVHARMKKYPMLSAKFAKVVVKARRHFSFFSGVVEWSSSTSGQRSLSVIGVNSLYERSEKGNSAIMTDSEFMLPTWQNAKCGCYAVAEDKINIL